MNILKIVKDLLIEAGIKDNIFLYAKPANVECILLKLEEGGSPVDGFISPYIEIRTFFKNNSLEKCLEARAALLPLRMVRLSGGWLVRVEDSSSTPLFVLQDKMGTIQYEHNLRLYIERGE